MKKLLFVICDGMDYEYTKTHLNDLPFINELSNKGGFHNLKSVVPADSIPSWNTIYTGKNPCEHGILDTIDYLNYKENFQGNYASVKGKVFWDKLSENGKKVVVVNPFMAYPAWDVNGLMISGPVFESGDLSISDSSYVEDLNLPEMGGITDYPNKKQMEGFFNKTYKTTKDQFDLFKKLIVKDNFDFGFLGILTLDRMQHFLWRYTDSSDITYVKKTNLHNSILESYKLIDSELKELYEMIKDEFDLLVISDHGHGKRCENTFYINRWLIENGFINNKSLKKRTIEYMKNFTLLMLAKTHMVSIGTNFFKKFKFLKNVKNADYGENKTVTKKIYAPNFDGVNPFGGIQVNIDLFTDAQEYNDTIEEIISKLSKVEHKGKKIVEWVKRREDIYTGEYSNIYPEIIYKLNNNYGVDRGLFGKRLFGRSCFHEIISGGHRWDGVCISTEPNDLKSVQDIYSYILKKYQ